MEDAIKYSINITDALRTLGGFNQVSFISSYILSSLLDLYLFSPTILIYLSDLLYLSIYPLA